MVIDRRFNFDAVNVLTATQHHVFLAVDDVDKAMLIETRNVACMEPAIGDGFRRRLRAIDIALDDRRPTNP